MPDTGPENGPDTGPEAHRIARLRRRAEKLGFEAFGVVVLDGDPRPGAGLNAMIAAGRHGTMAWLADTIERRRDPRAMWPEARSAIVIGLNYGPDDDPRALQADKTAGAISVYARNRDYHEIIKGRLKELAGVVAREFSSEVKVFVDTAPLMEKPLAQKAGLGWQGRHTNLVSRQFGSWLFLGVILAAAQLPADVAEADHCGSCRACLDACPTDAFPEPYRIDARRCISYLTIEHPGPIAHDLRGKIGNRIYGCDDCLAACPWNKFASLGRESRLQAREDAKAPRLADLLILDDAAFRARFVGSPIKRIGRDRFLRNVLIAAGNSGETGLIAPVAARLGDFSPLVRGAAVWALGRLGAAERYLAAFADETDAEVRPEWEIALGAASK